MSIETDRVWIVRRRRGARAWCPECGCQVDMIDLEAAVALAGIQPAWHSSQGHDGRPRVCLESLLKSLERREQS